MKLVYNKIHKVTKCIKNIILNLRKKKRIFHKTFYFTD